MEYRTIPGIPGQFFDCLAYRCGLSTDACARQWRAEKGCKPGEGRHEHCRGCVTGALHAGEKPQEQTSALYGSLLCPRCTKEKGARIVQGICISCYNREREIVLGRNAKGAKPVNLPTLVSLSVAYASPTRRLSCIRYQRVVGRLEAILRVLRKSKEPVQFSYRAPVPARRDPNFFD